MNTYICTKVIHAVPAVMVNGCIWPRGLPLPEVPESPVHCDDNCACINPRRLTIENGYMYTNSQDDTFPMFMPKAEFEAMCRSTENMTFGDALEALKRGYHVARKGWNGKNQYVELASCVSYKNAKGDVANVDHQAIGNRAMAFVGTGGIQMGWLASQADMLADDWYIVELGGTYDTECKEESSGGSAEVHVGTGDGFGLMKAVENIPEADEKCAGPDYKAMCTELEKKLDGTAEELKRVTMERDCAEEVIENLRMDNRRLTGFREAVLRIFPEGECCYGRR